MDQRANAHSGLAPLRRHWRAAVVVGVMATGLLVVALLVWPDKYESESKLFLRIGRDTVTLDPSAMVGPTLPISRTREGEITSAMVIFESWRVAQMVVDKVGQDRILSQPRSGVARMVDELKLRMPSSGAAHVTAEQQQLSQTNAAVRWVVKATTVECPKEASVISVVTRAATPKLAHDVTAAMTAAFRDEYLRVNQTEGVEAFFQKALDQRGSELRDIRARLRDELNDIGSVTLDSKQKLLLSQLTDVELAIQTSDRKTRELSTTISTLGGRIDDLPETIVESTEELESDTRARLEEQFYEFLKRESEQLAQLTPAHPLAAGLSREHRELEAIVKLLPANMVTKRSAVNPIRRGLVEQLEKAQVELAGTRALHDVLLTQREKLQAEVKRYNSREPAVLALQQELASAEDDYKARREQWQLARVQAAMDRARLSNVNVVQEATLDPDHVSPNRRLTLMVGLLLILGLSLSVPYILDFLRPPPAWVPLSSIGDALSVPILGAIPQVALAEPIAS